MFITFKLQFSESKLSFALFMKKMHIVPYLQGEGSGKTMLIDQNYIIIYNNLIAT